MGTSAKLLLATAHGEISHVADVVIVCRDENGIRSYTTMDSPNTLALLDAVGEAMHERLLSGGKCNG